MVIHALSSYSSRRCWSHPAWTMVDKPILGDFSFFPYNYIYLAETSMLSSSAFSLEPERHNHLENLRTHLKSHIFIYSERHTRGMLRVGPDFQTRQADPEPIATCSRLFLVKQDLIDWLTTAVAAGWTKVTTGTATHRVGYTSFFTMLWSWRTR